MKIALICFGDIASNANGYLVRCSMLTQKLVREGNDVDVYQYCDHSDLRKVDNLSVRSIKVKHEIKSSTSSRLEKLIGFSITKEVFFPFEGFFKLLKYRSNIKKVDVVYIESCPLFQAFILAKLLRKKTILDTHSVNKAIALNLRKTRKIEGNIRTVIWHILEKMVLRNADEVIAVSKNDANFIIDHYGVKKPDIRIIENEVAKPDAKKYARESSDIRKELKLGNRKIACFVGDMGAIQNKEARKYIEYTLAGKTRSVIYVLVGNNPERCASHDNIIYTGFVDAVDPYILAADVCIAPLAVGSGTKTKVLDYMKYNKSIIATNVALEGIDYDSKSRIQEVELENFHTKITDLFKELK